MFLLLDYDNIDQSERRFGVEHVVRKAFALCDDPSRPLTRATARIYGGWFEGGAMTRLGQRLAAEIRLCSPVRYVRADDAAPILIAVELATSILADPGTVISNTFRRKGYPRNIQCEKRPWLSCADSAACPLRVVEEFVSSSVCVEQSCLVQPQDVLHKQEQKVVDTMIVADLIHASQRGDRWLAVTTRDDDIWPGLSMASLLVDVMTHLSTSASPRVPAYYNRLKKPAYRRVHWS